MAEMSDEQQNWSRAKTALLDTHYATCTATILAVHTDFSRISSLLYFWKIWQYKQFGEFGESKKIRKLNVRQLKRFEQNFKLTDTDSPN